eukprot:5844660-Prymnesium_polylepis.1
MPARIVSRRTALHTPQEARGERVGSYRASYNHSQLPESRACALVPPDGGRSAKAALESPP